MLKEHHVATLCRLLGMNGPSTKDRLRIVNQFDQLSGTANSYKKLGVEGPAFNV
jgi:hypothetical protein